VSRLSPGAVRQRQDWLAAATGAAASASRLLSALPARGRTVHHVADRDVKIEADARLDQRVIAYLSRRSAWPILTEESGEVATSATAGRYQWIIDPLDGSVNHARGLPFSAVSIALWRGESPVLGVVHDLNRREVFTGIVGVGAWLNGQSIRTSRVRRVDQAILCSGLPIATNFSRASLGAFVRDAQRFQKVRLLGSAALSLAYVACGRADVYREQNIKVWDVAAGVAVVKAAGGAVSVSPGRGGYARMVTASCAGLKVGVTGAGDRS